MRKSRTTSTRRYRIREAEKQEREWRSRNGPVTIRGANVSERSAGKPVTSGQREHGEGKTVSVVLVDPVSDGNDEIWFNLSFDYNPAVVDIIRAVPLRERRYHPQSKTWSVRNSSWARLTRALEADGHRILG
jgi:hypothetical protein